MALVCDVKSANSEQSEVQQEAENPDLEDGEIEDDEDDVLPEELSSTQNKDTSTSQILPAPIPTDTNIFTPTEPTKEKTKRGSDRKSEKHLTEAEKCVRMLHKMERAERERRERLRREQMQDDWAGNIEKAIASVLKKDKHASGGEEEDDDEKKRGRKRKKKERERKKKHRKIESPSKNEDIDEDELLNVRGGSPENKPHKENSPVQEGEQGYESYESEYDSDSYQHRQNKRNFERDRKNRNRKRESRRERKNFRENNRKKEQTEQPRPQIQDANSICMFYMQGKCHKGEECPYSHDALPPMKLELCKFYLMDCCAKRDKCLYMHSEFPCKYYHTGLKCFAKENCKFAHGKPLNDSLKQVLLKHLETAPKEILGDFPRLSRDGAQHMVNQTQKNLEVQYGIKNTSINNQNEKPGIPSLFDINVPVPPELLQQQQQQQQQMMATESENDGTKPKISPPSTTTSTPEKSSTISGDKPTKVRHTRWNNEPPVPLPLLGQAFAGSMPGMSNVFSSLTLQDQQKIHEFELSYQMKGFYSEQDQDMRVNSNGDVDMRTLPQLLSKTDSSAPAMGNVPPTVQLLNVEQYKQDAGLASSGVSDFMMDIDIRSFCDSEAQLTIAEETAKLDSSTIQKEDVSDSSGHLESSLTIDEKAGDSASELPSNLPKKQRELFLRIQAQQKENIPENQHSDDDTPTLKDDDWYSSDDDNDPLSKMVIHLEDECKEDENEDEEKKQSPERILSPPTIKPVEVIDKLGDLSKIDISAEVTKLLTSIKSGQSVPATSTPEIKKLRDPRQAKLLDAEITSPSSSYNTDPRLKTSSTVTAAGRVERRDSGPRPGLSIYEQGIIDSGESSSKGDVDLRSLDPLAKDLDMRPTFGDTDLRQVGAGRQDVDLRQLGLQFKAIQNYTPATEIDASVASHSPIIYKVHVVDIPRPDYTGLKLNAQDAQVTVDPRLRKIFRVPSTEEKDSPASPKQTSPPKQTRQDPRKRRQRSDSKTDVNNLTYSQQLQLLQNSAFYQSLTSNQKVMLNQEIASKGDQNAANDPILAGILSNLGLIPTLANSNGCAMNILANVNSMVPINPILGANLPVISNIPQNINPNMAGLGPNMMPMNPNVSNQNMTGITPNLGPGLLGVAPGIPLGPNMAQNDFQINFNPRNGGLLGQAPFQNYPENQNFQYNDEFYPNNEDGSSFQGGNNFPNPRNDRNFRNDRNSQNNNNRRGRSWNNRHNNSRNFNRNNNNRNRSNRSYTPP